MEGSDAVPGFVFVGVGTDGVDGAGDVIAWVEGGGGGVDFVKLQSLGLRHAAMTVRRTSPGPGVLWTLLGRLWSRRKGRLRDGDLAKLAAEFRDAVDEEFLCCGGHDSKEVS